MSRDYEPVDGDQKEKSRLRLWLILGLLAFIAGGIATGWVMTHWRLDQDKPAASQAKPVPQTAEGAASRESSASLGLRTPNNPAELAARDQFLTDRVGELEERLALIDLQARSASGNAARAEGLLIAFAARRALDKGEGLGYIEGQLRLRFGETQPRAVATIINASREPVTLLDLQSQLEEIGPQLQGQGENKDWWQDVKREVGHLIVFRKEGTPSPLPEQRLHRAELSLEAGRVDNAMAEVARMPGSNEVARGWMQKARRYNEARRALDVIETAAILEPRHVPEPGEKDAPKVMPMPLPPAPTLTNQSGG